MESSPDVWASSPNFDAAPVESDPVSPRPAAAPVRRTQGLSERSRVLMSYALCGFANFGSLGIMIGGLGTMCPERRGEVIQLGFKSIVAGTLATCLTAASVGVFV